MLVQFTFAVLLYFPVDPARAANSYQMAGLDQHNLYRARHPVPPLEMNEDLNDLAVRCAQHYAEKGRVDHSCKEKGGAGENLLIWWGVHRTDDDFAIAAAWGWHHEERNHNFSKDFQSKSGHFSQLVWKSSKELGFGLAKTKSGWTTVAVALYKPPGNWIGEFRKNVFPEIGQNGTTG